MPIEHYQRQIGFNTVPVIHPCVFADDCSGTFTYRSGGTGTDYQAEYDPSAALVQQNGILLKTRATTPAIGDEVYIHKELWLPALRLLRLQLAFRQPEPTGHFQCTAALVWGDGTKRYDAGIHTDVSDAHVDYVSGGTLGLWTYTELDGIIAQLAYGAWNHIDLSIDLSRHEYGLLHFNQFVRDLRGVPLPSTAAPGEWLLRLYLYLWSTTASQETLNSDQILISPENP